MGKIVITNINNKTVLFQFNDEHIPIYIKVIENSMVNSVYIGKINKIDKGLKCAFVNIANNIKTFLPLDTEQIENGTIRCGDEIAVQIKTDAIKTKLMSSSLDICLPGEYCVLHLNGHGISASKKLSKEEQDSLVYRLKEEHIEGLKQYKTVIRTNSSELLSDNDITPLTDEIKKFISLANNIKNCANTRTVYSVLYRPDDSSCNIVKNIPSSEYDTVITDIPEIIESLKELSILKDKTLKLHEDNAVSLINLYSLRTHLDRALDKKVYLPCGGYLIIEPTEALTAIDVNSGKSDGHKKDSESYIYGINKEAAKEIARQLIIRNISGMIMVDFISMNNKEDEEKLLSYINYELSKDRIRTRAIDMTPLGIVEITRKKVDLSLDKALLL